ncbi:hypothetical protein Y032_0077g1117 [Ancylostoma ceylanicum]|uniref:VWFA domain-containing protein n=1 Tax=Ancylostoma ceylanicum TaxID=53326 RepID=A0A016TU38_9BILA|nr:hypothetical protein Y032_0077g1117 [Ancylostoma ceylanicum]
MRPFCLLFLLLVATQTSTAVLQCNSTDVNDYSCSRSVIIAIDATTNMGSYENVRSEFDFIENWILPRLDIRSGYVGVGMTAYGTGSTTIYDFSYNKRQICTNIEKLWSNVDFENANNVPLSRDQRDVDAAASQVEYYIDNKLAVDFSIVVVNYGNCSFSSWPKNHTDEYNALTIEPNLLSQYVDDSVCEPAYTTHSTTTAPRPTTTGAASTSTAGKSSTTTPPSTHPPTKPVQTTVKPLPTASATRPPTPTLPPASIGNAGCECVLKTVWLDVFLLMEATVSMKPGIDAATDYVVSAFSKLTIGQAEQYQTRLGVIRYASSVELIADLNFYTSTSDLFDLTIETYDETGTNIEGAIRLATASFVSPTHRAAARPVLVIVGNSYKTGAWNDPGQVAATFRESGGTIITIEYVQEHGLEVPVLRSIASPNYNLTNVKDDGTQLRADDLRHLLCEANCFCRTNWLPYNNDMWNAPQGGCYYPVTIPSVQV